MLFTGGLQLSIELSKVFPIGKGVETLATQVLNYARNLRKSGSDVVVEEDLADIFGRGKISPDIEDKFKVAVKLPKVNELHQGCEIRLECGPGPSMVRGFQDSRYLATIIQLSLLSWVHSRESLASSIAQAMTRRSEMGIPGAQSHPGYEGIAGTLTAISAQSSPFAWSDYIQIVNSKLQVSIPDYHFTGRYLVLTPALLLGAMDYFYLVQQLRESRKIIVSKPVGCITLIIWAHYVLGLNVVIETGSKDKICFGSDRDPHLIITWPTQSRSPSLDDFGDVNIEPPEIRLLDEDMSVILKISPEPDEERTLTKQERFPLRGYGVTYLYRMLNAEQIVSDDDPIYEESTKLCIGMAIYISRQIDRNLDFLSEEGPSKQNICKEYQKLELEVWRVLEAAKLIFFGITIDAVGVNAYVNFLSNGSFNIEHLPNSCNKFFKKFASEASKKSAQGKYLTGLYRLASVVFLFAHVHNIDECGQMPGIMDADTEIKPAVIFSDPPGRLTLHPTIFLKRLSGFLSSHQMSDNDKDRIVLYSDFGWSVYSDALGEKDPAKVRPDLVHIKQGTPTHSRTNERKVRIVDGDGNINIYYPSPILVLRGRDYTPRAAARGLKRSEFWSSRTEEFELFIVLHVSLNPEWRKHVDTDVTTFQEFITCGNMHRILCQTFLTSACDHDQYNLPQSVKLGPDAATILGWMHDDGQEEPCTERVLIYLTRGDAKIRWLALKNAVRTPIERELVDCPREVMLRTENCCDTCALEQATAMPQKWILIL